MENEDIMAELILRKLESKESLRKTMTESAWDYYTGRYLFGLITFLLLFGILIYFCIFPAKIPIWGLYPIAIAIIALLESKRNSGRVDAMIKLSELDRHESNTAFNTSSATG